MKKNYTLIIGKSPSKGARSPTLWNKVFKKKIDCEMFPLDVSNSKILKKNLKNLKMINFF